MSGPPFAEDQLEAEREWADKLARTLDWLIDRADDRDDFLHEVVAVGAEVTVGDVLRGLVARHDRRRLKERLA